MEHLTWSGNLGAILNPMMLAALVVFIISFLSNIALTIAGIRPGETVVNADHTLSIVRTPSDYALMGMKYAVLLFLACCVIYIVGGIVQPDLEARGIIGSLGARFVPVWIALIALFAVSITFKRKLGLYGKLFDSPIGMVGFGLVMFWIFTAIFAGLIATHEPLSQISSIRNGTPGVPLPDPEDGEYAFYLLGADSLGRDVFSRMVYGAVSVLRIAPLATLFAFMVGISLGLPAGYLGGRIDTIITFIANLVLAFPVILLFYLLVTPEIQDSFIPIVMGGVLFIFPILFFVTLFNSRFHTQPQLRNVLVGVTVVVGGWAYLSLLSDPDPESLFRPLPAAIDGIDVPKNILIVFVSVVFVNSPTVFRIVRGLVLDVRTRDYVGAAQTRGEGPWYIMLWEILPNARGPLIVDFCLRIGYTTILLGTLGFFGLGVSPESPDWGSTINEGRRLLTVYPHPPLPPALALMSLVLGLNLLADGLREESLKD